jgi:hypothetical protein
MNERIRELADKIWAEEYWDNPATDKLLPAQLNKFAELIVKKCMACSTWVGKMNTNSVEPVHTAHAINQRIKQQFGVEE